MQVIEVPYPHLGPGMVLVKNHYSLVSAGTEGSTVKTARAGLIAKAKERPQQAKQVLEVIKSQGPLTAYRAVMKKLDAWSPLGYSCVGEVIGLGSEVRGFQIGDWVACGGLSACHAEVVAVAVNLCVRLPRQVAECRAQSAERAGGEGERDWNEYLKSAAYNTLGAIALQGVRQADLRLGESCGVIGLGLLGQLTCMLLRASGVRVVGVDVNPAMVEMARTNCADLTLGRSEAGIEGRILEFTNGIGCDGVIITAASDSLDPINFAGTIATKRGTVVVVGAVPTGFDREPHYYRKELNLKMSCSYGPGRYDPEYEEKGRDYPVGYVRWTEQRNMQAFQELIAGGKIDPSYLTTHVYKLEDAPKAYDLILEKSEPFVGILIEYNPQISQIKGIAPGDEKQKTICENLRNLRINDKIGQALGENLRIGFIGAGSYAQSHLLPNIPKANDVILKGVMTSTSAGAESVADRFGFEFCTGNADEILKNDEINTIFIASRHDSHGRYVADALRAGKHVFVEKPLCLNFAELDEIVEAWKRGTVESKNNSTNQRFNDSTSPLLMVGYNRRFASLSRILKEKLQQGPFSMMYRVNAGSIPPDSWIQDREVGGGRILGEVCHFVDYLTFLNSSLPALVQAVAMDDPFGHQDTLSLSIRYANGSIGSIQYFANGSKELPKEYVEVYSHGTTAVLKDFRELHIYSKGRPFKKKLLTQDKGQKEEVKRFIEAVRDGKEAPIPLREILSTSYVCFAILESLRTGSCVILNA